ncbi:hypothetical protein ACFOON_03595 [Novosphingobium piscinae]|uniref:Helix-turn-helix domain-containing protein n=1 Tax=Novosphingobium piscinae TaxID=1507448 RepID=A0A7X1FZR6_9SPHN|nr:hypothetical protein [Novosphingobium piscinae]MBC2669946.1 hypothetical protein [Novosphingobium piscinae]
MTQPTARRRLPAFHPVPLRTRGDGWTPPRQARFIGHLAETRCVRTAAARVGLSRESAYRLRRRAGAEGFAAAWDIALGRAPRSRPAPLRKVTVAGLLHRLEQGTLRPVLHRGQLSHVVERADNSALLALLARHARAAGRRDQADRTAGTKTRGRCQRPCPWPPVPPI